MNRKLGPGALFVLGIALLYFGGISNGAIGVGLSVGGLVCLIAGIIGGIKKLFSKVNGENKKASHVTPPDLDMSDPGSVENSVKIQLHCYKGYKANYPKESPTQLYVRVLADRPGYGTEDIKAVLSQAHSPAAHGKYNFQSVVTSMLVQEYMQDNNGDIPSKVLREIVDTVERLIPRNI